MTENFNPIYPYADREPWNKGKLIGPNPEPPVWSPNGNTGQE